MVYSKLHKTMLYIISVLILVFIFTGCVEVTLTHEFGTDGMPIAISYIIDAEEQFEYEIIKGNIITTYNSLKAQFEEYDDLVVLFVDDEKYIVGIQFNLKNVDHTKLNYHDLAISFDGNHQYYYEIRDGKTVKVYNFPPQDESERIDPAIQETFKLNLITHMEAGISEVVPQVGSIENDGRTHQYSIDGGQLEKGFAYEVISN